MIQLLLAALAIGAPPAPDEPGDVVGRRTWDVEHLDLDVRVDVDAGRVDGTATHRIRPLASAHGIFRLHQQGLDIQEVRVDGAVVTGWRSRPGLLEIPVPELQPHVVAVRYSANPQTGLHFRRTNAGGESYTEAWTQGENTDNRHWFPGWDDPSDRFTLQVAVTARDPLRAWSNGVLTRTEPLEGGWTRWTYVLDQSVVNYLVALVVGRHQVATVPGAGIPMEVLADPSLPKEAVLAGTAQAREMLPFMESFTGVPFPYPVYRQATVQGFLYGGMENTTLTLLSDELLVQAPWHDVSRMEHVVAHELAHQWFGDLLTCYGWRELWLNEGFATYLTLRWWEHAHGALSAAVEARGSRDAALNQGNPLAARGWSKVGDADYDGVYTRGSSVLRFLEVFLGRPAFDAGIKRYVQQNQERLVETDDLRRALEDVSGEDLGWAFDQWVFQGGSPTIKVRSEWKPASGDDPAHLDISANIEGERPWVVPFDVEVGTPGGVLLRRVWLTQPSATVRVDLPEAPSWVLVDPQRAVLARFQHHQEPDAWAAAARGSAHPAGRVEALFRLGEGQATETAVSTLGAFAADSTLPADVREVAIEALARLGTPKAIAALLPVTEATDPEVRAAVIAALGRTPTREGVQEALEGALRTDPNRAVRARALRSLAHHDKEAAATAARRNLGGRPERPADPLRIASLSLLAAHGDDGDLRLVLPHLDPREARAVRTEAAWAAGALTKASEGPIRARLTEAILPLLDDEDQVLRSTAIGVLRQGGDEQAARALSAFAASTHLEGHAARAREAAQAIRARESGAPVPPAPADLESVDERLKNLEKRLGDLEKWL